MGQSIQQRLESHQPIQYQESAAVGDTHDVNFRTMGPTKTVPSGDLQHMPTIVSHGEFGMQRELSQKHTSQRRCPPCSKVNLNASLATGSWC